MTTKRSLSPTRLLAAYGWSILLVSVLLLLIGLAASPFSGTMFFLVIGSIGALLGGIAVIASLSVNALLSSVNRVSDSGAPEEKF